VLLVDFCFGVLPPGYEDELYCPAGHCLKKRAGITTGFTGPRSSFWECASRTDADIAGQRPSPWGSNHGDQAKQMLIADGYHLELCAAAVPESEIEVGLDESEDVESESHSHLRLAIVIGGVLFMIFLGLEKLKEIFLSPTDATPSQAPVNPSVPNAPVNSNPAAAGGSRQPCKFNCGRQSKLGVARSGKPFDTCCRACAVGKGGWVDHDPECVGS